MGPKPFQYSLFQLLLVVVVSAGTFGFTRSCGEFLAGLVAGLCLIQLVVRLCQVENVVAGACIGMLLACGLTLTLERAIPQPWHVQMLALPIYGLVGCLAGAIRSVANAMDDGWPRAEGL